MTEYKKIENELLSLGWTCVQGDGDHMKFSKEGINQKMTIPRSLSDDGRALKNTYASIRRLEPRFVLGRQEHMLGSDEKTAHEEVVPEGIPDWIQIGTSVRWTAPEGHDWSRIGNEDAVMNKRYVVTGFKETDDGPMIVIKDSESDEDGFAVSPSDVAVWSLGVCDGCGQTVPESCLKEEAEGKHLCEKCAAEQACKSLPVQEEPVKLSLSEKLAQKDPLLGGVVDVLKTLVGVDISQVDEEVRAKAVGAVLLSFPVLSPKAKKALKNDYGDVLDAIKAYAGEAVPEEPITPKSAWVSAVDRFVTHVFDGVQRTDDWEDKCEAFRKKVFSSVTYPVKPLKDRKLRRKNVAYIVSLDTNDYGLATTIWSCCDVFILAFSKVFEGFPVVLLVKCPKAGLHQYAVNYLDRDLDILEANLPNSEKDGLSRLHLSRLIPPKDSVYRQAASIAAKVGLEPGFNTGLSVSYDVMPSDKHPFAEAKPILTIEIVLVNEAASLYGATVEAFKKDETIVGPVSVRITNADTGESYACESYSAYQYPVGVFDDDEQDETDGEGGKAGTVLFALRSVNGTFEADWEDTEDNRKMVVAALCASAEQVDGVRDLYSSAIDLFRSAAESVPELKEKYDALIGKNDKKSEKNMEDNILDRTNPDSELDGLGNVTTRALLKELKLRGVEFDNLTITVRKSISMDEI